MLIRVQEDNGIEIRGLWIIDDDSQKSDLVLYYCHGTFSKVKMVGIIH